MVENPVVIDTLWDRYRTYEPEVVEKFKFEIDIDTSGLSDGAADELIDDVYFIGFCANDENYFDVFYDTLPENKGDKWNKVKIVGYCNEGIHDNLIDYLNEFPNIRWCEK